MVNLIFDKKASASSLLTILFLFLGHYHHNAFVEFYIYLVYFAYKQLKSSSIFSFETQVFIFNLIPAFLMLLQI